MQEKYQKSTKWEKIWKCIIKSIAYRIALHDSSHEGLFKMVHADRINAQQRVWNTRNRDKLKEYQRKSSL